MSQPLDLCVTLTSSPQGEPANVIASLALHCETLSLSHAGDLLTDPLTQRERRDLHLLYANVPPSGQQKTMFLAYDTPGDSELLRGAYQFHFLRVAKRERGLAPFLCYG